MKRNHSLQLAAYIAGMRATYAERARSSAQPIVAGPRVVAAFVTFVEEQITDWTLDTYEGEDSPPTIRSAGHVVAVTEVAQ